MHISKCARVIKVDQGHSVSGEDLLIKPTEPDQETNMGCPVGTLGVTD